MSESQMLAYSTHRQPDANISDIVSSGEIRRIPEMGARSTEVYIGKYRILGLLGKGGMGTVYLAEQTGPGNFSREVVIKRLHVETKLSDEARQLLLNEARLTALINHPNVVTIHEVGEHHGQFFMALERVRGISFQALLRRLRLGRLPPGVVSALIAQACDGLHAAHALHVDGRPLNMIHRDISTSNLMCDVDGRVRVIDFGIARAEERQVATDPSIVRGNIAYMAPEQISGCLLDRTADIFSLALVYYEMCTGVHPFHREGWRVPVPSLKEVVPQVSATVSDVLATALALEPEARPEHIYVLGEVLWDDARRHGFKEAASVARFFEEQGISLQPPDPQPIDFDPDTARWRLEEPETASPKTRKAGADAGDERQAVLTEAGRRQYELRGGLRLDLHTTHIRAHERGPHEIGLSRAEGILPVPLVCTYTNGTLSISCAGVESAVRSSLYLDACQPSTRMERLLLTEASPSHTFELGHRKSWIRRIRYKVAPRTNGVLMMKSADEDLPLTFVAPEWASMMVLLTAITEDPGIVHVECMCLERSSA